MQSTAKENVLNKQLQFAPVHAKGQLSVPSTHGESFPDIETLHIESNSVEKLLCDFNPQKAKDLTTSHPDC